MGVTAGDEQGEGGVGAEQFCRFQEAIGASGGGKGIDTDPILLCCQGSFSCNLFTTALAVFSGIPSIPQSR